MKQWYTLLIAFGMPLLLVAAVFISIRASSAFVNPSYDILYATGRSYGGTYYFVKGDRLTSDVVDDNGEPLRTPPPSTNDYAYENQKESIRNTRFYRYDPERDSSSSVGGYADAVKLTIVSIDKSPDGYRVTHGSGSGGGMMFPFFFDGGSSGNGFLIEGNGGRKKVQLAGADTYPADIIGWIQK